MRPLIAFFVLMLVMFVGSAAAQPAPADASATLPADVGETIHYVVKRGATVYSEPDGNRAYLRLGFREPIYVLASEGGWSRVRTQDGAQGYVESSALSNVWIRVSKQRKKLYLYKGMDLIMQVPADFGYNAFADKVQRGSSINPDHWRTPEGTFFVVKKNPYSRFYKALVVNYPTAEDARRGYKQGLISKGQHDAIVRAENNFNMPPMTTPLGGMIEIHGDGTAALWLQCLCRQSAAGQ